MSQPVDRSELYRQAFEQAIREHKEFRLHPERGREFVYVAREILTIPQDTDRVARKLAQNNIGNERGKDFAGMTRLLLPPANAEDVPRIVRLLRDPAQWPGERTPVVQPHHVVFGHGGNMHGHPGQPPRAADPIADPAVEREGLGKGVTVGILDTGISRTASADHPRWLRDAFLPRPDEVDAAYAHDDVFALEGGHGTFVAGVVRQAAPGARFDPERALSPVGLGTEEEFAQALSSFDEPRVQVVNISLGCFTLDDVAPEPVRRAVERLPEDVVVVASAGNQGTARPSWPAALPRVTAVAALAQERDGTLSPACYSNHGHWVDACAVGNRTSTFLKGRWVLPGQPEEVYDRFAYWLGTSFAAPHVAGRIAATMTESAVTAAQARDQLIAGQPEFFPGYGVYVE
ncbi:S8 family peptidase [Saccharothrix syringae]|uniref:Peptidase S8/S53 subtilisin kexin sedolisin n=1 Tax=Saccharothrix syringae TaxID=103733 RepID=A0A5Q0H8R0_SACSY|nr:S8 family serine peptidase [Saccharothrix syringae]QFZ22305.1 peptidase S8/S53 subtilisin kexin sedolisin [Saccharothrix syringae]